MLLHLLLWESLWWWFGVVSAIVAVACEEKSSALGCMAFHVYVMCKVYEVSKLSLKHNHYPALPYRIVENYYIALSIIFRSIQKAALLLRHTIYGCKLNCVWIYLYNIARTVALFLWPLTLLVWLLYYTVQGILVHFAVYHSRVSFNNKYR